MKSPLEMLDEALAQPLGPVEKANFERARAELVRTFTSKPAENAGGDFCMGGAE